MASLTRPAPLARNWRSHLVDEVQNHLTGAERPAGGSPQQPGKYMDLHKGYYSFFKQTWTPNVNLYEIESAYMVCVDLAGVDKSKIDVEVVGQRLTIKGSRVVPVCAQDALEKSQRPKVHAMEIDHGAFERDVELPQDVLQDQISARYNDGLLWIELPKKPG